MAVVWPFLTQLPPKKSQKKRNKKIFQCDCSRYTHQCHNRTYFWLPHPQPHLPLLRMCACSAYLLPASRWVGCHLLLPVAMGTLSATPWPIRRPQGRTKSAMRWWTSLLMLPAMCFRDWRNGHCTMCGLKPILMSGRALRAATPQSGRKRMVCFLNCIKNLSSIKNF